jgi:hypothetical protein
MNFNFKTVFFNLSKNLTLNLIFLASLTTLSSCAFLEARSKSTDEILQQASHQKVFYASYDKVWKAVHTALKYTIASENQDFGTIETDFVKTVDGWMPPYKTRPQFSGARYKLLFSFAKGEVQGKESTRLTIEKKIETFKNIIADTEIVSSDGTEEKALFYRIERELIIAQALEKAALKP